MRRLSEWKSYTIQQKAAVNAGWGGWTSNQAQQDERSEPCPWAVNDWSFNPQSISVITAPSGAHSYGSSTALLSHNQANLARLGQLSAIPFNIRFLTYFFLMVSVFLGGLLLAMLLA